MGAMPWVSSCIGIIASIALAVVGLVKVRSASGSAGYLLGGAGVVSLLTACCMRGMSYYVRGDYGGYESPGETMWMVQSLLGTLAALVFSILVVAGFAALARAGKGRGNPGREA